MVGSPDERQRSCDTIEILFELADGKVGTNQLKMARSLLLEIGRIDNAVQLKCAEECTKSGLHPRNYEGELAYIRMFADRALLRYWGTGVNTEWDELVLQVGDGWSHRGLVRPNT